MLCGVRFRSRHGGIGLRRSFATVKPSAIEVGKGNGYDPIDHLPLPFEVNPKIVCCKALKKAVAAFSFHKDAKGLSKMA